MNTLEQMLFDIADLRRRLDNLCRMVTVTEVDVDKMRVTVQIAPDVTINNVAYLTRRASANKTWWTPEVGEVGLLYCPSGDLANAFFTPGLNTETNTPPAGAAETQEVTEWRNGDKETHDYGTHSHELVCGDSKHTYDREKVKIEHKETNYIEITKDDKITIQAAGSNNKVEIENNKMTLTIGTNKIEMTNSKITLTVGANKIQLNAANANINGATFVGGVTNLFAGVNPVTYVAVPIT